MSFITFPVTASYQALLLGGEIAGTVHFSPNIIPGVMPHGTLGSTNVGIVAAPTIGVIVNGVLLPTSSYANTVTLYSNDPNLHLSSALQYVVTFIDITVNGVPVTVDPFVITAPSDSTPVDLVAVSPGSALQTINAMAYITAAQIGDANAFTRGLLTGPVDATTARAYLGVGSGGEAEYYTNLGSFPVTGLANSEYVADDTGKIYRWNGSAYVELSAGTVNSSDAYLLARANHTGSESADVLVNGTTNAAYTLAERATLNNAVQSTSTAYKVYSTGSGGSVANLTYASTATAYTLMERDGNGNTSVATPTVSGHATTKGYVDSTTVSEVTTPNKIYATDGSGAPTLLTPAQSATAYTMVQRDISGCVNVATPTAVGHAATKAYVDSTSAGSIVSVKSYGATGNGTTDDTTAVANAYTAAHAAGEVLYFPAGTYLVTSFPAVVSHDRIVGDGRYLSTIMYAGTGTLLTLTGQQNVDFSDLGFYLTGAGATGIVLSGCFRCSFTGVVMRGAHDGTSTTYQGQVGFSLTSNTGGTSFVNCDMNNLGNGIKTTCIENHIVNSKFATCWKSLYLVGGTANAGIYMANVEFVGGTNDQTTYTHLLIDGSANSTSMVNVWMEGCKYGAMIGDTSGNGPSQFSMVGCKVAGRTTGLLIQSCRQANLMNVEFDADASSDPSPLAVSINSTYCPEGVALNLVTTLAGDFADSDFPQYWTIARKGSFRAGNIAASNITVAGAVTGNLTGAVTGNASTATSLATSRTFQTNLASTTAASFNGTANNSAGVTGTLPAGNGGTGLTAIPTSWTRDGTPGTTTSTATPSINVGAYDTYTITALAAAITGVTITGTPANGWKLIVRIKDNGTARAITWGSSFVSSGAATLLSTTIASMTHTVGFIYDSVTAKWVCVAVDTAGY